MKHLITYLWLLVASVAFSSCTQNGGDIGVWFGTWTISSVTVDGTVVPPPAGSYYSVQFQGEIVQVTITNDRHDPTPPPTATGATTATKCNGFSPKRTCISCLCLE